MVRKKPTKNKKPMKEYKKPKTPKMKKKLSKKPKAKPETRGKLKYKQKVNLKTHLKKTLNKSKKILRRTRILKNLPKASSGIAGFDQMTQGGFEKNSINLTVGATGSGKTIFAMQFLMEGIKKGETTLFVTFEEKKDEFYKNMKKFGWDLDNLEKNEKFIFLEYSPEKVKMMLDEGGGTIESLVLRYKITRMVIDSITSFTLLFDDALSKKQANLGLFDILSKWNTTTILTVQDDPAKTKTGETSTIEFEGDSITLLHFIKQKRKRKRFIEILKMRGTNHSKETHEFEIKNGIQIGKRVKLKELK